MLALAYIAAASQSLVLVHMSGNYIQTRRYLWACLADALVTGIYEAVYGAEGVVYLGLYAALSAALLASAWTVGWKALMFVPSGERRQTLLLSLLVGLLCWWTVARRINLDPYNTIQLVSGSMLAAVVVQVYRSLDFMEEEEQRQPFLVLWMLWVTQALFFFMFAVGYTLAPSAWLTFGDWLRLVTSLFLCVLSFTFKPALVRQEVANVQ